MKRKLTLKKELKKIISRNTLKKKIILSIKKKYSQINKNSLLLNKFDKQNLKFPLFYKKLKKDFSDFVIHSQIITILFTEYLIVKEINLLKNFYLNDANCLNKIINIITNKKNN